MDWQAYSPDLNLIEHVWDALERRIAARLHHPENTQELKQMLIEEWALLPQEMLHQLVLNKNDNLRNPLKMPSAENAISAIKLFAFLAKMHITEPVLPYTLEEWIPMNIPAKYRHNIRKNVYSI
ncbi:transposable element Tc3 transposase [Trichonephila clavipes]|nr:transposable element Tc3 transposase [Trichonephila clavipes]